MSDKITGKPSTRAKNKYNAKAYDQFLVTVPSGHKNKIDEAVKKCGYTSRNDFIKQAINEKLEREVQINE